MPRQVPGLGTVEGLEFPEQPNVQQYRGIPYGSVPARFRQSELVTKWENDSHDGTKFGPLCPFPKFVIGFSLVQKPIPALHDHDMDEFKCLNLNVTCPKGDAPSGGWPVVVWIHGGGNVVGSGSDPVYEMAPLVNRSVEQGTPIVGITINYRFGAFGFMASDAIKEDNAAAGTQGVGNYGLRDQLLAFEWVKKNVKAFGGNPARVTAMGHSAGSIDTQIIASSEYHRENPLFNQIILQSGVAPLAIRGMKHQQSNFDKFISHLKIDASDSPGKLAALRAVSADELVKSYIALGLPMPSFQATVDGYFLKSRINYSDMPQLKYPPHLKRILLGDVSHEGCIFVPRMARCGWDYEKLKKLISAEMGQDAAQVMKTYGISPDSSPEKIQAGLVDLVTDAEFAQPMESVAHSFPGEVFYYHLCEGNRFSGPSQGLAHHGVDLLYTFMTYLDYLPEDLVALSKTVAGHWLTFINGGNPWTPAGKKATGEHVLMQYGNGAQAVEILESEKAGFQRLRLTMPLQDRISHLANSLKGDTEIPE